MGTQPPFTRLPLPRASASPSHHPDLSLKHAARRNASTHRPSTCARSQDPMRPSPLRTSRAQRAPPSPPPSTHLILHPHPHPHPPPARLLRPPMPLLPPSRVQSATNKAYYRSCKRATSRSTTYACSIPKRPRPSRHPTAVRVANSRGSSSALRPPLPFLPPFFGLLTTTTFTTPFFFFWFRFFCRLGYPRYGFPRGRWMGLVLMVCSRFDRRRPPTRSYGRVTYARFPDATSRSRTDDDGHCARRDEAHHCRSRFVPQHLTHHTPGLLVLARIVPLEDIPYVVCRARF